MRALVVAPFGKTGRHVIAALRRRSEGIDVIGFARSVREQQPGFEVRIGDLETPADRAKAVQGVDAIVHYGPAFHPRETAMGTGMIDAAVAAGVKRFVYISVIHPQIDALLNHKAKLAVEAHLIESGLDWTILRPQHYMQNTNVQKVIADRRLGTPFDTASILGHVDLNDLADAVATVLVEPGHTYATYDIAAGEHMSSDAICELISKESGVPIESVQIDPKHVVAAISAHHPLGPYETEALHRLFGYYGRKGIRGNAKVLGWLIKRQPATFLDYVRRSLENGG